VVAGKFKVLILTDHSGHSKENSLYDLSVKMLAHSMTAGVDVASRANEVNGSFFNREVDARLQVTSIGEDFKFSSENHPLEQELFETSLEVYDLVWLRLPPPLSQEFLGFINETWEDKVVINDPKGIYETGSKEFLLNFPALTPPTKICSSLEEIVAFKNQFPIVLKPLREYGGRGLVRVENDSVWMGTRLVSFAEFAKAYSESPIEYLGVKYLKNVGKGDKRVVVVNGEILGASLRLPPKDSWICNVSLGGSSNISDVDEDERKMVEVVNPVLTKMGIVMYGLDTLVGDDGKRILSEINSTSIGGLPQIAALKKQPLVEKAIDLIWSYFETKKDLKKKK